MVWRSFRRLREKLNNVHAEPASPPDQGTAPGVREPGATTAYHAIDDDSPADEILDRIHGQFFAGKGPDTRVGLRGRKAISCELSDFEVICAELAAIPELATVTGWEWAARRLPEGRVPILLRHDVDGDLDTAVAMAEIEARYGLRGTYYLLPAALYYSDFYWNRARGVPVRRYRNMAGYYRRLQDLGHEVGLHYFPYGTWREKGLDGIQGMKDEVRWLRAQGLQIRGGAGHSSAAAQGADSAEVFTEFPNLDLPSWEPPEKRCGEGPVVKDGIEMPRHVLSYRDVPLDYVLELTDMPTAYWAIREDGWVRSERPDQPAPRRDDMTSIPRMLVDIRNTVGRKRTQGLLVLNVHPVHVRARIAPTRAEDKRLRETGGEAAWVVLRGSGAMLREPGALNIVRYSHASGVHSTVATFVNRYGLLDYEPDPEGEQELLMVSILGSEILDCPHLQISQQLPGWLRKVFWLEERVRIVTRKWATANADTDMP